MSRVITLLGLLAAALMLSLPAAAKTLKFATVAPAGTVWMKEMKTGADAIERRTSGRVKIKFYPGGVMGNDQSVHRKIKVGQLHGGAFTPGGLSQVYSGIQSFSLPMLFESFAEVDYVRERMDPVIKRNMEDHGFVILGISEGGFARILSKRPMQDLETIRSSKVWVPEGDEVGQTVFSALGINPIPLPIADVYTGLQTGLIETVAVNPAAAIAFQWHTSTAYMTDVLLSYIVGTLAIEKRVFDRLSAEDQAVVREEMGSVFERLDKINREDNIAARAALEQQGISFVLPGAAEIERWRSISDASIGNMVENGSVPGDLVEQLRGHLRDFRSRQ